MTRSIDERSIAERLDGVIAKLLIESDGVDRCDLQLQLAVAGTRARERGEEPSR